MDKYFVANWKMSGSLDMIHSYFSHFETKLRDVTISENHKLVFCVPAPYLTFLDARTIGLPIITGAQDCTSATDTASTAEISAEMLKDCGCEYVIVGHSEYRSRYNPSTETLVGKLNNALSEKLTPIFCFGESFDENQNGLTFETLKKQLELLSSVPENKNLILAYEPLWAIGTGKTPSLGDIQSIGKWIQDHVQSELNIKLPILYGGSVKPETAKDIIALESVDGVLVGGASLDPESFAQICF